MKILMINVVCGIRSTGRICTDIATTLRGQGHEVRIAYGRERVPEKYKSISYRIGNDFDVKIHGLMARLMDRSGFGSQKVTKDFVKWIEEYDPDVIHLHNLHGYYVNVGILFDYLKKSKKKVVWTLHDCWSFTGHCSYFDYAGCNKWETGCHKCPLKHEYPKSMLCDQSKNNYLQKKQIFSGLHNMIIVTPSNWLADLVKKSFLKEYEVKVIHNGIDTNVFKPSLNVEKAFELPKNKKIVLGVAAVWDKRKGLADLLKLSERLGTSYQMVLVGLTESQIESLPSNVIGIKRTNDVQELASLYSRAAVYVNPTYEDNYPTTNLEAIACGTPVVSYDTGGSGESAKLYGTSVEKGNVETLYQTTVDYANHAEGVYSNIRDISIGAMIEQYMQLYREETEKVHDKKD